MKQDQEPLQVLSCAISERDVVNADKAAEEHRAAKKAGTVINRPTLSVLAVKIKRKKNTELPFGKFAKDHKLTAEGSGRDRTIRGKQGHIFLHPDYAYSLQYIGTRADARKVFTLVKAGAVLIDTDRLVAYREVRVRDEEVLDDDGATRIEGRLFNEFKYPIAEDEKNMLAEVLKAPMSLTLAFNAENPDQVDQVIELAGIERIKRTVSESQKVAGTAALALAREASKAARAAAKLVAQEAESEYCHA